jgi:protein TonB
MIEVPLSTAPIFAIPVPPEPPVPGPVRFSGEMGRPLRLSGIEPVYTEAARRSRTHGVVILDAVIDENGQVTGIKVLKGLGFGLTESAVRAVSSWRFRPAELNGRAIAVRYSLTVRFSLR